jgi:hypothetical protein
MESSRAVDTTRPHLEYRSKGSMSARRQALSVSQHASENHETNSFEIKGRSGHPHAGIVNLGSELKH